MFQLFAPFEANKRIGGNPCPLGKLHNTPIQSRSRHTELNHQHQNRHFSAKLIAPPSFPVTIENLLNWQTAKPGVRTALLGLTTT